MINDCTRDGTVLIEYSPACFCVITELAPHWGGARGATATLFGEVFAVNCFLG